MYHEAHGVQIGTLDQRSRLHSSFRHPEFADGRIEDTTNQMLLFRSFVRVLQLSSESIASRSCSAPTHFRSV